MRLSRSEPATDGQQPLHVEFRHQQLTSYSGLSCFVATCGQHELPSRLRAACVATGSGLRRRAAGAACAGLLYVGARRWSISAISLVIR